MVQSTPRVSDCKYRERKIGRALLAEALTLASALGIRTVPGFVFAHNHPSLRLLRAAGFETWGELPDVAEMDGREYSLVLLGKRTAKDAKNNAMVR